MSIRDGIKTTEFWVSVIALIGTILTAAGLPGLTVGAGVTLATWVAQRGVQKLREKNAEGKRAFATTEFWIHLITAGVIQVFPDLPQDAILTLWGAATGYTTARTLTKVAK